MANQQVLKSQQFNESAAEAGRAAANTANELKRSELRQAEQRWRRLAAIYEYSERLSALLDDTCGWLSQEIVAPPGAPASVPELDSAAATMGHPRCSTCSVPMWLVRVDRFPDDDQQRTWIFECKVCDARLVLPPLVERIEVAEKVVLATTAEVADALNGSATKLPGGLSGDTANEQIMYLQESAENGARHEPDRMDDESTSVTEGSRRKRRPNRRSRKTLQPPRLRRKGTGLR
jgi:hypothetical protein